MAKIVRRVRRVKPEAATRLLGPISTPSPPRARFITNETLNSFNPSILGLGNISQPSQEIEAVTAVFDLTGFTKFCTQPDAYLAIPTFLNDFLNWLFARIKTGLTDDTSGQGRKFWAELPVLVKFLGDGALILWNTRNMNDEQICRIVTTLYDICYAYQRQFYPRISMVVNKPPSILRCGIARGKVFSIGDGSDFVGHCINTASRLSHLSNLSFCFPHRGFRVQDYMSEEYRHIFVRKLVPVRGVGANELVWIVRNEFDLLPDRLRAMFRDADDAEAVAESEG